jgi:hypothetical protein
VAFGVEIDVAENPGEFAVVVVFNRGQGGVDDLADVVRIALRVQFAEARAFGQHEPVPFEAAQDAFFIIAEFAFERIVMFLPGVRDVFQEQHDQQVVFVFAGVDGASEGVAGFPEHAVDFGLVYEVGHRFVFYFVGMCLCR